MSSLFAHHGRPQLAVLYEHAQWFQPLFAATVIQPMRAQSPELVQVK